MANESAWQWASSLWQKPGTDGSVHSAGLYLVDAMWAVGDRFVCPRFLPQAASRRAAENRGQTAFFATQVRQHMKLRGGEKGVCPRSFRRPVPIPALKGYAQRKLDHPAYSILNAVIGINRPLRIPPGTSPGACVDCWSR